MFSINMRILIFSLLLHSIYSVVGSERTNDEFVIANNCPDKVGSEKSNNKLAIPDLNSYPNKDFIRIYFPNGVYDDFHKDSPVADCFNYTVSVFFVEMSKIIQFFNSLQRRDKKAYVNERRNIIFQEKTFADLGSFFRQLKNETFTISSSDFLNVEKIINISYLAAFLRDRSVLNLNIDTQSLRSFSDILFNMVYLPSMNKKDVEPQDFTYTTIKKNRKK